MFKVFYVRKALVHGGCFQISVQTPQSLQDIFLAKQIIKMSHELNIL